MKEWLVWLGVVALMLFTFAIQLISAVIHATIELIEGILGILLAPFSWRKP